MPAHRSTAAIEAALAAAGPSPADNGSVELIVCRPQVDERCQLDSAELHPDAGVVGDSWAARGSRSTANGHANPAVQLTLMNSRIIAALAPDRAEWLPAGDQLFVDLDLSEANLPPGTRLQIGAAVVEVSSIPHTGCAKFTERYGVDAIRFVNGPDGLQQRRRGLNARVLQAGVVRPGDTVTKLPGAA